MENGTGTGDGDRIERDAQDIVEAGQELGKAREREVAGSQGEASVDAQIAELQRKKDEYAREKQEDQQVEKKDEQRIADDLRDIEQAEGQGGGGNNPEPGKATVTIIINTADFEEPKRRVSYGRVVGLAYPDFAAYPNATYSIMYERGPKGNPQGVLSKGGSVEITEGMRFRVKRTGES